MRSSPSSAFRGEAAPPPWLFRNVDLRFLNGGQAPFVVSWPLVGADRRPPGVPATLEAFRGAGVYAGWFEGLRRPFVVSSTSVRRRFGGRPRCSCPFRVQDCYFVALRRVESAAQAPRTP